MNTPRRMRDERRSLKSHLRSKRINELKNWLLTNTNTSTTIKNQNKNKNKNDLIIHSDIDFKTNANGASYVVAKSEIPKDTVLLRIPIAFTFTSNIYEIKEDKKLRKLLTKIIDKFHSTFVDESDDALKLLYEERVLIITVKLMYEIGNIDSLWDPLIASLPPDLKHMPLYWKMNELQEFHILQTTFTGELIACLQQESRKIFHDVIFPIVEEEDEINRFSREGSTLELSFLYALSVVLSEGHEFGGKDIHLIPLVDKVNVVPEGQNNVAFITTDGSNDKVNEIAVITTKRIYPDEEILLSCGEVDSSYYIMKYGKIPGGEGVDYNKLINKTTNENSNKRYNNNNNNNNSSSDLIDNTEKNENLFLNNNDVIFVSPPNEVMPEWPGKGIDKLKWQALELKGYTKRDFDKKMNLVTPFPMTETDLLDFKHNDPEIIHNLQDVFEILLGDKDSLKGLVNFESHRFRGRLTEKDFGEIFLFMFDTEIEKLKFDPNENLSTEFNLGRWVQQKDYNFLMRWRAQIAIRYGITEDEDEENINNRQTINNTKEKELKSDEKQQKKISEEKDSKENKQNEKIIYSCKLCKKNTTDISDMKKCDDCDIRWCSYVCQRKDLPTHRRSCANTSPQKQRAVQRMEFVDECDAFPEFF